MKLLVGIPTFKRPEGLRSLLESLTKLEEVSPEILVVDNEGLEGAGLKVVDGMRRDGYRWPITVVSEPERGISQARNKLLDVGFGDMQADYLAMVDDDTLVEPQWLSALLHKAMQSGADVVDGKVIPIFPDGIPIWAKGQKIYFNSRSEAEADMVYATTSVLLGKAIKQFRFDPAYSRTGSGDTEFFMRLKSNGIKFAHAPLAISYESYTSKRANLTWAIMRSFRIGQGYVRIKMKQGLPMHNLFFEVIKSIGALLLAGIQLCVVWNVSQQAGGLLLAARQVGKVTGLMNMKYEEYKL